MVERRLRLRREAEVRRTRARGRSFADGPLVARVLPNGSDPPANRYAVVAGKKVGKAVQRNRLKRLVREAIRHLHPELAPGHDVVVVVRGTVEEMPGYEVARGSLDRIVRRAGLLRATAASSTAGPSQSTGAVAAPESGDASRPAPLDPEPGTEPTT